MKKYKYNLEVMTACRMNADIEIEAENESEAIALLRQEIDEDINILWDTANDGDAFGDNLTGVTAYDEEGNEVKFEEGD